ncbi:hypothetical protein WAI453_007898 [Rhynchosporium graminicola]
MRMMNVQKILQALSPTTTTSLTTIFPIPILFTPLTKSSLPTLLSASPSSSPNLARTSSKAGNPRPHVSFKPLKPVTLSPSEQYRWRQRYSDGRRYALLHLRASTELDEEVMFPSPDRNADPPLDPGSTVVNSTAVSLNTSPLNTRSQPP